MSALPCKFHLIQKKTGLAHNLPPVYKISNWLGKPVNNESGEQIGTIRDMVMDDYGRFRYVIMENENRDMVYLPEAKDQLFEKLDANDDAAITKKEAKAHPPLAEQFERIDSYDNGRITRSEFALFEVEESGSQPD